MTTLLFVLVSLLYIEFGEAQPACPEGYWDPAAQTCFLYAGKPCGINPPPSGTPCIPTAACYNQGGSPKCVCQGRLKQTSQDMCHLLFMDRCNTDHDMCDPVPFLKCSLEKRCDCGDGATWLGNICVLLPGSKCSLTAGAECIPGTRCNITNETCECDDPLSKPSVDDPTQCYLPHGVACGLSECDPYAHLECGDGGTCICQGEDDDISIYDERTHTCLVRADEVCTPGGMLCIHSSSCKMSGSISTCQCRYPMSPGSDKFCYLQHEQDCTRQNDMCDPNKFLTCNFEGKCACNSGAAYISSLEVCKILPGSECSTEVNTTECISGTRCNTTGTDTCECDDPLSKPSVDDPTQCYLSHGVACTDGGLPECDPYAHLSCGGDGSCICQGENVTSIYDTKTKKCLKLADVQCVTETDGGMSCIYSATCNRIGSQFRCECRNPMSRGVDGFCYLKHNQSCIQINDLCDKNKYLECNLEGKCSCQDDSTYDRNLQKCVLLPGSGCSVSGPTCINGTKCNLNPVSRKNECVCSIESSIPSVNDPRRCILRHGDKCSESRAECDPYNHLVCSRSVCICLGEGDTSRYDNKTRKCVQLADEDCLPPEEGGMSCIHTASCKQAGSKYKCQCRFPMSRGVDGLCHLSLGQSCTILNDLCDPNKYLECSLEGKCSCRDDSTFDTDLQKCVLLPGSDCNMIRDGPECIQGTRCELNTVSRKTVCTCSIESSIPSVHDPTRCFLHHGDKCSQPGAECDPFYHFECKKTACACQGEGVTAIYDNKTRKCVKLADEECLPQEEGGMGCIHTASCKQVGSKFKCQCRFPMTRGSDGLCHLSHAQDCGRDNDFCNVHKFLHCDYEGKCSCGNNAVYDTTLETCLLLPEQGCNSTDSQLCFPPTKCNQINSVTGKHICVCPGLSHPSRLDPTRCVLDHSQPCANSVGNDLCDPFKYLECSDALQCQCKGGFRDWYDKESKTCFLKAKQSCIPTEDSPFAQKCTPNSHCYHKDGVSLCVCNAGFEVNKNGHCFLPHLSKCRLENDLCDPASFLSCDLETNCTCGKDGIFNRVTKTCELLSSATCNSVMTQPESQKCIGNAMCSKNTGRCECIQEFEENKDRFCFLPRGNRCDKSRDLCDPKSRLECGHLSGSCVCQGEEHGFGWYNRFQKKCFRLAESPCENGDESQSNCVHNAFCDPINKMCTCNETLNLSPNRDGFCFLRHGVGCNLKNDLCDPAAFLECYHEAENNATVPLCRCERDYETFYDANTSSCRLIHDRPCNLDNKNLIPAVKPNQLCDKNAMCLAHAPGNFTHRCGCNDKFSPNPEGICYLSYQSECISTPQECDPYGYLTCRKRYKQDGKADVRQCLCATDKMYYDHKEKKCFSFPGEMCDNSPTGQKCRKNAHCGKNYVCECNAGYEETPDGQCLLKYGEKCDASECHHHVNLECRSGFCLCPEGYIEHYFYSGSKNKTLCLPGYHMNCEEKMWTHFSNMRCSPDAFLVCNETAVGGVCKCKHENQVFIGKEKQCQSTRLNLCDGFEKICADGMNCVESEDLPQNHICQCAENYTINWVDPKFCISPGRSVMKNYFSFVSIFIALFVLVENYFV